MMQAPIAWFLFQQVVDISQGFSVFRDFWGAQKYALTHPNLKGAQKSFLKRILS